MLNFIGDVSKILFGTLTQTDAEEYNKHISILEQEQAEILHLTKEEMTIVRSTINTVNLTIHRIIENEAKLKKCLESLNKGLTDEIDKVQEETEGIAMINEKIRVVERGLEESQKAFELVIDALVHAEQGTVQPQVLTKERMKFLLKHQQLPSGLDPPDFPFTNIQHILSPHTNKI